MKLQNRYGFCELTAAKGAVSIGNACWIGDNVIILPAVTVGDGAVIGAGSIVTKDVPPFAVVAGNPARLLKYRFSPGIIAQLLEIRWWDWDVAKIRINETFFNTDLSALPEDFNLKSLLK